MNLLKKIRENNICKISLLSVLDDMPLTIQPKEGNFSTAEEFTANFDKMYFTANTPNFTETGKPTEAGTQYLQEFSFRFPTNEDRTEILRRFQYLKLIKLHFCDGKHIDLGRNDYHQNKFIEGSFKSDLKFTELQYSILTIFPFDFIE